MALIHLQFELARSKVELRGRNASDSFHSLDFTRVSLCVSSSQNKKLTGISLKMNQVGRQKEKKGEREK